MADSVQNNGASSQNALSDAFWYVIPDAIENVIWPSEVSSPSVDSYAESNPGLLSALSYGFNNYIKPGLYYTPLAPVAYGADAYNLVNNQEQFVADYPIISSAIEYVGIDLPEPAAPSPSLLAKVMDYFKGDDESSVLPSADDAIVLLELPQSEILPTDLDVNMNPLDYECPLDEEKKMVARSPQLASKPDVVAPVVDLPVDEVSLVDAASELAENDIWPNPTLELPVGRVAIERELSLSVSAVDNNKPQSPAVLTAQSDAPANSPNSSSGQTVSGDSVAAPVTVPAAPDQQVVTRVAVGDLPAVDGARAVYEIQATDVASIPSPTTGLLVYGFYTGLALAAGLNVDSVGAPSSNGSAVLGSFVPASHTGVNPQNPRGLVSGITGSDDSSLGNNTSGVSLASSLPSNTPEGAPRVDVGQIHVANPALAVVADGSNMASRAQAGNLAAASGQNVRRELGQSSLQPLAADTDNRILVAGTTDAAPGDNSGRGQGRGGSDNQATDSSKVVPADVLVAAAEAHVAAKNDEFSIAQKVFPFAIPNLSTTRSASLFG